MKKKILVKVLDVDPFHKKWPPNNLAEFIAYFSSILAEIPEQHRSSAEIDINACGDYDGLVPVIKIAYARPETDEEEDARELRECFSDGDVRRRELETLTLLMYKYPEHYKSPGCK